MSKIKRDNSGSIACLVALTVFAAGGWLFATKSFSAGAATALDYFKGSWTVKLRSNPREVFRWTVKEDLQGDWLAGVVEKNGEKVSTDFWRQRGQRIERFAFTAGGMFVRIESSGWESGRLVLTGMLSDQTGETKIRETITKINGREFHALWERLSPEGRWVTFADEICTK